MPIIPVIRPPVRNEISLGKALAKSLAGETTLAAIFTDRVATTTVNIEIATTTGCENCPTSLTGSHASAGFMFGNTIKAAEVIRMPIAANNVIVVGNATTCPITCSRWLLPNRVKSGMFKLSVAQNPIIAVNEGINTGQNSPNVRNLPGSLSRKPTPPAWYNIHASSNPVIINTYGAAQFSTIRNRSIPLKIMAIFMAQKIANESHSVGVCPPTGPPSKVAQPGINAAKNVCKACPPIHACMPNQPHATIALIKAGRFDPTVPYAARANTGNGMPYFVPGCELSNIGASTIVLPSKIVNNACHQFIPAEISPDAIIYVGMQCAMEIQSAA